MATAIFYASSTGNTERAAKAIREQLGGKSAVKLFNIADSGVDKMNDFDKLLIGVSTWGSGDLQDDWEEVFNDFKALDFSDKTVAFFGLGDQEEYSGEYLDAMGTLYDAAVEKGANVIGAWPTEGYEFDDSRAVHDDMFVGLALDEDNQDNLTEERVAAWVEQIKNEIL